LRVLFLTLYPESAASPRYRVAQFVPYLQAHGVECTVACPLTQEEHSRLTGPDRRVRPFWYHARETPRRLRQLLSARRYDVVVVQKAISTAYIRGMAGLIRGMARRLVYDMDDAVHLAPPHPLRGPWRAFEDRDQIRKLFNQADLVLAGNAWLADQAAEAEGRVALFPTVVDTARFVPASTPPDQYRIGWIGNPSTTPHLAPAAEALGAMRDGEVCLVGAEARRVPFEGADVRAWSLDREVPELQHFSFGIMPLPRDEWVRGKCALKALQYLACGIPCVATPFGAACDILRDGENGLFADSPEAWREAFDRLRDPALRQRLGEAGRAAVEDHYGLDKAAPRMLELLETIA
jgi:glycosyltransferase involved in cell wall biosynthesis